MLLFVFFLHVCNATVCFKVRAKSLIIFTPKQPNLEEYFHRHHISNMNIRQAAIKDKPAYR